MRPGSPRCGPISPRPSCRCVDATANCAMAEPIRAPRSGNSRSPCARSGRQILARPEKFDLRPALLGKTEIDARRRQVDELAGVIDGEIVVGLVAKLCEPLLVLEPNPARDRDIDGFEYALHVVFVREAKCDDLELQLPDRAQDQVVVAQRLEQLRRALFAQLG